MSSLPSLSPHFSSFFLPLSPLRAASCTGTGIVLVVALRSVGIPARLAGCSESVVRGALHRPFRFLSLLLVSCVASLVLCRQCMCRQCMCPPWPLLSCAVSVCAVSSSGQCLLVLFMECSPLLGNTGHDISRVEWNQLCWSKNCRFKSKPHATHRS